MLENPETEPSRLKILVVDDEELIKKPGDYFFIQGGSFVYNDHFLVKESLKWDEVAMLIDSADKGQALEKFDKYGEP
jgi:hypothetical protein